METKLFFIITFFLILIPQTSHAVTVGTVQELIDAVNAANSGGDKMIECENGTYQLPSLLHIIADSITVKSLTGERDSVIIRGQGMNGNVSHVFLVQGSNFHAHDLTIGWVANHAIQIQGEQNADCPVISNVHFVDTYEQMLKVSTAGSAYSDSGIVEYCLFEYSAGIGPQYYIGGIDCHRGRYWIVRNCVFKDIKSPSGSIAEHAIHFWNNSEHTLAECNLIINCDRGIGYGLGSSQHIGGIIRNNMIYHDTTEGFADVGISLETCPNGQVYNNTVYQEHSYQNAIEYRFSATTNAFIANNLTNRNIQARDGASGTDTCNITNAQANWFVDVANANLHLDYAVPAVIDQGMTIAELTHDFDGDARPQGAGYDIGADEYTGTGIGDMQSYPEPIDNIILEIHPNPFSQMTDIRLQITNPFREDPRTKNQDQGKSYAIKDGIDYSDKENDYGDNNSLRIYNAAGRLVKSFDLCNLLQSVSSVCWDGTDQAGQSLPAGVYFICLESSNYTETKSVILIK